MLVGQTDVHGIGQVQTLIDTNVGGGSAAILSSAYSLTVAKILSPRINWTGWTRMGCLTSPG